MSGHAQMLLQLLAGQQWWQVANSSHLPLASSFCAVEEFEVSFVALLVSAPWPPSFTQAREAFCVYSECDAPALVEKACGISAIRLQRQTSVRKSCTSFSRARSSARRFTTSPSFVCKRSSSVATSDSAMLVLSSETLQLPRSLLLWCCDKEEPSLWNTSSPNLKFVGATFSSS